MDTLELKDNGLTVKAFQIKYDATSMLHIVASNPTDEVTLTFHRSTDAQTFTAHPETLKFTGFVHEPLYGLKQGEWLKITANHALSNAQIMW